MDKNKLVKIQNFLKKYWKPILVVVYLVSPLDIIPDVLLPLGYTDDALMIIALILEYVLRNRSEVMQFDEEFETVEGEIVD